MISRIFFATPPCKKPAIGDGVSCLTPCKRGRSRAQLGDSAPQAMSLVEGRSRQATHRWGHMWHETNKKPPRWGCEGWRPIVVVMPKSNGKHASPLSFAVTPRWLAMLAPHISHRGGKKVASRKKSRLRRKKRAYRKQWPIVWKAYPFHRTPL